MDNTQSSILHTRRDFIRRASCAAVGTIGLTSTLRDLRFMNAAMATCSVPNYKALVCIFLAGGNDSNNLIIPIDPTLYANYAAIRTPLLAIPLNNAPSNQVIIPVSSAYGLHPACPNLANLYSSGKLAVMFNTG